jgi:antirestriction protein ArdC
MKGDPSFIFRAATQASKATDYLLAFVQQPQVSALVQMHSATPSVQPSAT